MGRHHGEQYGVLRRSLFEYRYYRRLLPLVAILCALTLVWCGLVLALGIAIGGVRFVWQTSFAQNVVASLLVLPLGLTVGVLVGAAVQKHALRFQVRHAGDKLSEIVRLTTFKFVLFLRTACKIPIDISGPVDARLVRRARNTIQRSFIDSHWSLPIPSDLERTLEETVNQLDACFRGMPDLRMAFPRAFDLMEGLHSLMTDIKAGTSVSDPRNSALIVLHYAIEMIRDLE